jgi:hypothetical protein
MYFYNRYLTDDELFNSKNLPLYMLGVCVLAGVYKCNPKGHQQIIPILNQEEIMGVCLKHESNALIISLNSTMCFNDVLTNLQTKLVPFYQGKVHKGYFTRILELFDNLHETLKKSNRRILYLTGHSMGGALVTILAHWIYIKFPNRYIIHVYTFGSPKYCDHTFHEWSTNQCTIKIFNYLNICDPVIYKPVKSEYTRTGKNFLWNIDTKNDNVNHGIRAYKECVQLEPQTKIKKRIHRYDEILSRFFLDLFS